MQNCKVEGIKATGKLPQRQPKKCFFSRVSEATLGSFSGPWDVLGAKLGGVSAFRVVSISRAVARCKIARLKATKRQESYRKGSQKKCFFWSFRSDVRQFCWSLLGCFGREIRWCFSVSSGVHRYRAVALCKIARLKASKRQESYRKGSQKKCFFWSFRSDVRQFFWSLLGCFERQIRWCFSVSSGVHR